VSLVCEILSCSLSGDDIVLLDSNIGANSTEESWGIRFRLLRPDPIAQGEREGVVIGEDLANLNFWLLAHCSDGSILGVQPRSLDVGVLLRVTLVTVFL
jgi:hypothetical protein